MKGLCGVGLHAHAPELWHKSRHFYVEATGMVDEWMDFRSSGIQTTLRDHVSERPPVIPLPFFVTGLTAICKVAWSSKAVPIRI